MKFKILSLLCMFIIMFSASCSDDSKQPDNSFKDIDGNKYTSVKIGAQTWMVENLKTTKYRNGDPIPNVTDQTDWADLTTGGYCIIENNYPNSSSYNRLYNWYAVADSRNIAPEGWHVPTDAEWTTLTDFLGGENSAGGKLKEMGTVHWCDPNTGAMNSNGFTALPGGTRTDLFFLAVCQWGTWWTATEKESTTAYNRIMFNNDAGINRVDNSRNFGMSVRCIKD
jgi:uncharacterized protein (TIGR02145 family)